MIPFHDLRALNTEFTGLSKLGDLFGLIVHVHELCIRARYRQTYATWFDLSAEGNSVGARRGFCEAIGLGNKNPR